MKMLENSASQLVLEAIRAKAGNLVLYMYRSKLPRLQ